MQKVKKCLKKEVGMYEILFNFAQPRGPVLPVQLRRYRDMSPSSGGSVILQQQQQPRPRRLSRVVKCRTVDFTEFPEGMRDYMVNGKRLLREIQSQPGSPTLIPRIEIHDFGSEVVFIQFRFIGEKSNT